VNGVPVPMIWSLNIRYSLFLFAVPIFKCYSAGIRVLRIV
jgi:hypothetical protein